MTTTEAPARNLDFIREIVEEDLRTGKHKTVVTRFPPEPNGYLHIGHAKSICLNFGVANEYGGHCNLRFDDTNPTKEELEYAQAIERDVRWLGFEWGEHHYHASDYFEQLFAWAIHLIEQDKAYVDSLTAEEMRAYRGTLTEPGKESPYRNRGIEENLDLFRRMRAGEFPDGAHVLRAKIDMAAPNINMRDPVLYRIRHEEHHRTGDAWNIYPMYDYAHPLSDAIEHITHSLCTLEFEDHRPLYDWLVENCPVPSRPRQYEFARLNLNYTVMSKRKLLRLVQEKHVNGWDDPRMPTISALRRRGYTPAAIRNFAERVGVARRENVIDVGLLEFSIREDLNKTANRVMGVLKPLKVVIENYPEEQSEEFETANNADDPASGTRRVPFSRELYIEQDDFMEEPPKKFFRLAPGREVRLRSAYFITCTDVVKDADGNVVELRATYDPATRGGDSPDGRRPKATLHWVSAAHALDCEVRLYDRLFNVEAPEAGGDFLAVMNPNSLEVIEHAKLEPSVSGAPAGTRYQFERLGYFCIDPDSTEERLVFNRTATLKDAWAPVFACINTYSTTLAGKRVYTEAMPAPLKVKLLVVPAAMKRHWQELRQKTESGGDHESRTDYAAALLHLGEVKRAVQILEAVEAERPGLYHTAANLGTAYELSGDDAKARHWIAEGVRRNPESHEGTEWVHLAILDAKLAQARDSRWLETHSVLQLDFGAGRVPQAPNGFDAKRIDTGLTYQLRERLQFVKAPDPYVGDLFFDWGNTEMLAGSLENAVAMYEKALEFGTQREALARKRMAEAKKIIRRAK